MSAQHTPGRLKASEPTDSLHAIRGEKGRIVADVGYSGTTEGDTANARRLVACEGLSTEHLEQHGLPGFAQMVTDARAQRDELLAALVVAREIVSTDRQALVDCGAIHELTTNLDPDSFVVYADGLWLDKDDAEAVGDYDRALAQIDAAIAKATGSAS
jgi:hypothetical protein